MTMRAAWDPENPLYCDTFWGSHGCNLPAGHDGPCMCVTVIFNEDGEEIERYEGGGCCGPPYFGAKTTFFSNHDTPTPPQTIAAAVGSAP